MGSEIAHDVLIETINILATIAQYLEEHSNEKVEKHEKVRAGCIAYSLFVIYGTESTATQNEEMQKLTADNLNSHDLLQPNLHALAKSISVDSTDAIMAVSDNEDEEHKDKDAQMTEEEKKQ